MSTYQLHRRLFPLIAAMMSHGVVVYGYGRNGKRVVSFCEAAGIPVRAIYDRNVNDISNSGGVRPSSDIPSSGDHDAVCILTPAQYDIQFPHFLRNEDPVFIVKALFHAGKVAFIDADLYVIRNYPREDRNANDCAITAIVSGCREIVEFAARHDLLKVFCHELDVIEYNYPNIILKFFNNQMMSDLVEIKVQSQNLWDE